MKISKLIFGISILIGFVFLVSLTMIWMLGLQDVPVQANIRTSVNSPLMLSTSEVAKHNLAADCWMIINNKVYDFTSLTSSHSGGASAILRDCGKDGTQSFATKGGQGSHSSGAKNQLDSYYLGNLNQVIGSSELQNKSVAAKTVSGSSGEDEEDDDD
ncbi:MAG: cytochrome b5 domain-containing protein [Candidatus Woesearchaeota archaeon]|jgi:cytochrome b involved in lipid metabolism